MAEKTKNALIFIAVAGLLASMVAVQWNPSPVPVGNDDDSAGDDASAETDDDDSSEGTSE